MLKHVDSAHAGDVLNGMSAKTSGEVIGLMGKAEAAKVLDNMDNAKVGLLRTLPLPPTLPLDALFLGPSKASCVRFLLHAIAS